MKDVGRLKEFVAFDSPTETDNGQGGTVSGWLHSYSAWAEFRYLRGGETVLQARLAGTMTIIATVRDTGMARLITPEWRMRDVRRGTEYNIRSIIPTDDRLYLELTCQSGVAI